MVKLMNNNTPGEEGKTSPGSTSDISPVIHNQPSPLSSSRTSPESISSLAVPISSPAVIGAPPSLPPPSPNTSTSSLVSPSPLNKLQSMHPFDYRKSERRTPEVPRSPVEKPIPPSMSPMRFHQTGLPPGYPIPPSFSLHHGISPYQHQMSKFHDAERKSKEENHFNPMNLSRNHETKPERNSLEHSSGRRGMDPQRQYSAFHEDLGTTFVNPATGKKRVQCNVCLKTFCDKGALKIHFSAVHLREMHKCSVPGCNMMFSSRRSRNRHSANPNPKLHTPHIRRKISPHDGRTHQGPVIPFGLTPKPPISQHHLPVQSNLPVSGVPPFHHFHSLPPNLIPPELHKFHHQQMELQRFHEMQKLSSLYSRHLAESEKVSRQSEDLESISEKLNVTDPDSRSEKSNENGEDQKIDITDDEKSLDNSSSKEEGSNGRKRKRQNPTRIQTGDKNDEDTNFSSDDNDEGFPDPMDDDDEDEHQMDFESGEGGSEKSKISEKPDIPGINQTEPKPGDNEERINDVKENKTPELNGSDREEGATGKIQVRNDLTDQERIGEGEQEENQEDMGRKTPLHSDEEYDNIFDEIPIDKENPLRCVDCGREFQNHFSVKIHYQNVHLKLVHKCTIDGCNAAFPSKRSRDRHSSNLALHRKLLSTTEMEESSLGPLVPHSGEGSSLSHLPSHTIPPYQNEFLARFFAEQQHQHQQQQQQQQQQRFPFPFLPGLHSHPSHPSAGLSHPRLPPPFGMLPFNPLLGDLSRLPGLFNKVPDPSQAKMVEENLRKYMAMANMATKIENH